MIRSHGGVSCTVSETRFDTVLRATRVAAMFLKRPAARPRQRERHP